MIPWSSKNPMDKKDDDKSGNLYPWELETKNGMVQKYNA